MKPLLPLCLLSFALLTACGPDAAKFGDYAAAGQDALRSGDWPAAYESFRAAARIRPSDGRVQYNLGMAAFRAGRPREAARAFETAASLLDGGDAVDALLGLARVRADQRRWDAATDALSRAKGYAPDEARQWDILAALSGLEFRQRLRDPAHKHAAEVLAANPDHPVALYNLGCVFLYLYDDKPAALRAFSRYYEVAGESLDDEAANRLDGHLKFLPNVQEGTSAAAQERIRRSNETASPAEGLTLAQLATQEDPLSDEAWFNYAGKCVAAGEIQAATEAYRRFIHLNPTSPDIALIPSGLRLSSPAPFLKKAAVAVQSGNTAAARKQYEQALAADPLCYEALSRLVDLQYGAGDIEGARKLALRAEQLRPNQPAMLFRIGCYYAADPAHTEDAVRYYRLFLRYGDPASNQAATVRQWLEQVAKP